MLEKKIEKLYEEAKKECEKMNIPFVQNMPIKISKRMTRSLGKCCFNNIKGYSIRISQQVEVLPDVEIKQIIVHEILHSCPGCMNHGTKWLSYADKMNKKYHYNISCYASEKVAECINHAIETTRQAYVIECQHCNQRIVRTKKSKLVEHPEWYLCGCGGQLKRVK